MAIQWGSPEQVEQRTLAIAANRASKASALAQEILHRASERGIPGDGPGLILFFDALSDVDWFLAWRGARCASAPSAETKAVVRHLLLSRMPRCMACGLEPATREAGKAGRPGKHLCERDWRAERGEP